MIRAHRECVILSFREKSMKQLRGVLLIVIVLATLVPLVSPDLLRNTTVALQLRKMTDPEKRNTVIGLYYRPLHAIRQSIPETESVAIVMAGSPLDRDVGVFANYYLYPRPSMFYRGIEAYRENKYEGSVTGRSRPSTVILIDHSESPEPRLLLGLELLESAKGPR
jgi:hypothetical protein